MLHIGLFNPEVRSPMSSPPMPSAPERGAASGDMPARVQLPMVITAAVGIPNYRIRAVTPSDGIVIAPEQDEYFPIFYSSVPITSRIYGIDLLSQEAIGKHLLRARDEDTLSAVPDFIMHSRDDDRLLR